MSHPSKNKGNAYERELVNQCRDLGIEAKRAYASNGQSLGCHETVDLIANEKKIQAKRRKSLLKGLKDLIKELDHTDAVVFREDKAESFVLIRWQDYLELIAESCDRPTCCNARTCER